MWTSWKTRVIDELNYFLTQHDSENRIHDVVDEKLHPQVTVQLQVV